MTITADAGTVPGIPFNIFSMLDAILTITLTGSNLIAFFTAYKYRIVINERSANGAKV